MLWAEVAHPSIYQKLLSKCRKILKRVLKVGMREYSERDNGKILFGVDVNGKSLR